MNGLNHSTTQDDLVLKALEYCAADPVTHIDISEAINRGHGRVIMVDDGGLIVQNTNTQDLLLACKGKEHAQRLALAAKAVESRGCVIVRGEGSLDAVADTLGYGKSDWCYQFAYLKAERPCVPCDGDIRVLDSKNIPDVISTYRLPMDEADVQKMIDAKEMFGIYGKQDGELWGFIGKHDDGSGGMLEIFPQHRRKGLGMAMEVFLLNDDLNKGYVPYGQVFVTNEKSINLQQKLGMTQSKGQICWTFPLDEE